MFAALTPNRKFLNLSVVNATASERSFDLHVAGAKLEGAPELWRITGRDLAAHDQVGQPPEVEIRKAAAGSSPHRLSVAPYSIDVFRIPVAPGAE
jgi:alpha-L-arabinofuranosidase